ncbi:MAG: hypothetical protein KC432_17390, partial [Thermomicrobiales bacterium]|nr:hypothetical protein [Thermomicrobiales bacterium]
LDALRARDLTISVAESGTAARFGSFLLAEPAASGLVLDITSSALEREPPSAITLAESSRKRTGSDAGVGVVLTILPVELGLYDGVVEVAVTGALESVASFPIRAAFIEIQRRSAMHAADLLRRSML